MAAASAEDGAPPDLEQVAATFRSFVREANGYGRFYEELGPHIGEERAILQLAAKAIPGQPKANILFAAVQYLLLGGTNHPLAAHYARVAMEPGPGAGDAAWPDFRAFCRDHDRRLATLIATRRVQTNEVGRCALLRPALQRVVAITDRPLAVVEVGASAGLLLVFDRYAYSYRYPDGTVFEAGAGRVSIECDLRGEGAPPLVAAHPPVMDRIGLDLNPLDASNPDDARWLRALVWPDQPARAERLRLALEDAASDPPRVLAGDALALLPGVLSDLPPGATPVVLHAWVLNQFSVPMRQRFETILQDYGRAQTVYRLGLESAEPESSRIDLFEYSGGDIRTERLGRAHAHGQWLEWAP